MNSTRHHGRTTVLAAVVIAAAATACSHGDGPVTAAVAPTPVTLAAPQIVVAVADPIAHEPIDSGEDVDFGLSFGDEPIDRLAFESDTDGTGPQIALRFLRALQRHEEIAAARTLTVVARLSVSVHGEEHLHQVMADVDAHARLSSAGRCTSAARLNPDAAVVTCGTHAIVVHVADDFGVQLAPWHPRGDVYRGPHTHAYSDLDV